MSNRESTQGDPHYQRFARAFAWLAAEPGIGIVTAAGAPAELVTAEARQLHHHACRGLPRLVSQLLRLALLLADEQGLTSLDASVMHSAIEYGREQTLTVL